MVTLFFGDSSVTLVSGRGNRIDRTQFRTHPSHTQRSQQSPAAPARTPLGREAETARIWNGIHSRIPVEVYAPCGFGKSELLRSIADRDPGREGRGISAPRVHVEVGAKKSGDILQLLVQRLYVSDRPVRLSREACARLVSGSRALLLLDDVPADLAYVGSLVDELPGCGLVFAGQRPVLGSSATSVVLPGLSEEAALRLLMRDLGRRIVDHELPAARRLVAAAIGSPLQIRQAAALERENVDLTLDRLAQIAERDAGALDRRSLDRMSEGERRALAVLTAVAGARLPASVIGAMGDLASVTQFLVALRGRGLLDYSEDQFGLPVCRAEGYRQTLLRHVQLASAVRALADWLISLDPTGPQAAGGAEAAVALLGVLAEQREWALVVRLARVTEPVLFVWGRWEAWRDVLEQGLEAARWTRDTAAEAYFNHQKGTLEYAEGRPEDAYRLLNRARELRRLAGDRPGEDLTAHNLSVISPRGGDGRSASRRRARRTLTYVGTALGVVALVAGTQQLVRGCAPDDPLDDRPTSTTPVVGANDTETVSKTSSDGGSNGEPGAAPTVEISPADGLTIVDTTVGSRSTSSAVTVTNTGDSPLTLEDVAITGVDATDFTPSENCPGILDPDATCTITVDFEPQTVGAKTGDLVIEHSASGSPTEIQVKATAIVGLPDLVISEVEYVNDRWKVTVKNVGNGDAPKSMTEISYDGSTSVLTPSLRANESKVVFDAPLSCIDGGCTLTARADVDNDVANEANEKNNTYGELPSPGGND